MIPIDWHQRAEQADLSINHCIEGELVALTEGETIDKISPRNGSLLYSLPVGTPTEVEHAIVSARQAYQDKRWRGLALHQRLK